MMRWLVPAVLLAASVGPVSGVGPRVAGGAEDAPGQPVDATSIHRKLMCGYQGWFRCPGDAAGLGWVHWSRDPRRIAPETLTFELWPDMTDYPPPERYPAPGFRHPDGRQAYLFSSDDAATVLRHFTWMRDYGIDGAFVQHFVVGLKGGPVELQYQSHRRVIEHVRAAARATGRVWALAYDIAGMPVDRSYDVLTRDWKAMVDEGVTRDSRYLHQAGKPVVQVWGFYHNDPDDPMTAELANRLTDFFKADGPGSAYLIGGGDWSWRRNPDPAWHAFHARFDAYMPWNVGNVSRDLDGVLHASTGYWADDLRESQRLGVTWVPVVYPGFAWDNLMRKPAGTSTVPRRKGAFFWEQFHELTRLGVDTAYVAMFDEVDEGTAIFKVTSSPPAQAHFVGYEGMPADWYLRLAGEGGRMIRGERPVTAEIPILP
jgi:hypothetical protein